MVDNLPKFTIKSVQHRKVRVPILYDVVIADEVVEGYEVAWVRIRGAQDPIYQSRVQPHVADYQVIMEEAKDALKGEKDPNKIDEATKLIEDALSELLIRSVTCCIEDWDEDFFGGKFSQESALEVFRNEENNIAFNQISGYMRKREDFLPKASV